MSTLSRRVATAGVMAGLMVGPAVASAPAAARDHQRHATADHRSIARDISDGGSWPRPRRPIGSRS